MLKNGFREIWDGAPHLSQTAPGMASAALGGSSCRARLRALFRSHALKLALGSARSPPNARLLFTIVRMTLHYRVRGTAGLVVIHKCMQWFLTKRTL